MSYIIPREIPSDCTKCRWAMCNYPTVYCRLMHKGSDMLMAIKSRPDWCPLIEVKVPHGELIDKTEILEYLITCLQNGRPRSDLYSINEIVNYIEEMDVIVKAEEKVY